MVWCSRRPADPIISIGHRKEGAFFQCLKIDRNFSEVFGISAEDINSPRIQLNTIEKTEEGQIWPLSGTLLTAPVLLVIDELEPKPTTQYMHPVTRKRIGITATVPVEIILAAGLEPIDLNNLFIS